MTPQPLPVVANQTGVGDRRDLDRLLGQSVEELPAGSGFAAVESEDELIEIILKVGVIDGALMGPQQPTFHQGDDAVRPAQHMEAIGVPSLNQTLVSVPLQGRGTH